MLTHIPFNREAAVSKKYDEYAAQRTRRLSPEGRSALRAFHGAHAVGRMLSDARAQRGYTQQRLSDLSGVTQADISRIERGLLSPTTATMMRLAEALDADIRLELRESASA